MSISRRDNYLYFIFILLPERKNSNQITFHLKCIHEIPFYREFFYIFIYISFEMVEINVLPSLRLTRKQAHHNLN